MERTGTALHLNVDAVKHRMVDMRIPDYRTLAKRAGVDYTGLCRAMARTREPSREMIARLSITLGMDFNTLLALYQSTADAA